MEDGGQEFEDRFFDEGELSGNLMNEELYSEAVDQESEAVNEWENTDLYEVEEFGNLKNQQQSEVDETKPFDFAGHEEETAKELSRKLKFFSLLPHTVEVKGKDVALTPTVMDPGIYDGPEKFKVAPKLQKCLVDAIDKKGLGNIKIGLVDLTKDAVQPGLLGLITRARSSLPAFPKLQPCWRLSK